MPNRLLWILATVVLCILGAHRAAALGPDEILLIVNKNSVESQKLAALYAQLRQVPPDRTVTLDLPDAEEMPFNTYETQVVGPVRQFLEDHHLQRKIKCLLTFYGVPFRVAERVNTAEDLRELAQLHDLDKQLGDQATKTVEDLEQQAVGLDASFKPGTDTTMQALTIRVQSALAVVGPRIDVMIDPQVKGQAMGAMIESLQKLGGPAEIEARLGAEQRENPNNTPEQRQQWEDLRQQIHETREQIQRFQAVRWDPKARAQVRTLWGQAFGLLGEEQLVLRQIDYFATDHTAAATDNELALLWWDYYPRANWVPNPLYYRARPTAAPVLAVMRLDGPSPAIVEAMMRTSIEVEQKGLAGIVALDARGLQPIDAKGQPDPFGAFDEHIRDLGYLLQAKTKLELKLDDQDEVFPAHSVKNVALYCGWYSVAHYVPGCDFNPGAVGYHIASYEMVSLHEPSNYWVRGLLRDGVVATLGPVAEPYLAAFPLPDEFFPLLLTGKLSLAEVYWKTTPMASWMISFIGDPLYMPYAADPAMRVEDLPAPLRAMFAEPISQPATRP
jgi:uncharacterized protein (TIGR03790 family)